MEQTIREVMNRKEMEDELKELKFRISECKKVEDIQLSQIACINADSGLYMAGIYNGMELFMSIIEGREPMFCDVSQVPEQGLISDGVGVDEVESQEGETKENNRTIAGKIY